MAVAPVRVTSFGSRMVEFFDAARRVSMNAAAAAESSAVFINGEVINSVVPVAVMPKLPIEVAPWVR